MSKKRVHEIAKEQGLSSKELLEKLHAAGVEAKAAASSVEEALALKALGGATGPSGGAAKPPAKNGSDPAGTPTKKAKPSAETASAPAAPVTSAAPPA